MSGAERAQKEKFVPISKRLSDALKGWNRESITAFQLDLICTKVKKIYQDITWGDFVNDYSRLRKKDGEEDGKGWEVIYQDGLKKVVERNNLQNKKITEFKDGKSVSNIDEREFLTQKFFFEPIGADLYKWLEDAFKKGSPRTFAQATYIIFNTENPFLYISSNVVNFINGYIDKYRDKLPNLTESGRNNMEHFIQEENFAAHADYLNDWGYCQETSQVYFELLKDKDIGPLLFRDTILFANKEDSTLFPAQMFVIFEKIRQLYPSSKNYQEAIKLFYQDYSEGIFNYFQGKLNINISGMQRRLELHHYENELFNEGNVLLALFSGSPIVPRMEAALCGLNCITVDAETEETLGALQNGGTAIFPRNELLPGQSREHLFLEADDSDNISGFDNIHIVERLPNESNKLDSLLPEKIAIITDKRGSLLYLKGEQLLEHLHWLFDMAQNKSTENIYLSKGIGSHMIIDLVLKKEKIGWNMEHIISALRLGHNNVHIPFDSTPFANGLDLGSTIELTSELIRSSLIKSELKASFSQDDINLLNHIFCKSILEICGKNYDPSAAMSSCEEDVALRNFASPLLTKDKIDPIIKATTQLFRDLLKSGDFEKSTKSLIKKFRRTEKISHIIKAITSIPIGLIYDVIDQVIIDNEFSTSLQGINTPEEFRFTDKLAIE